MPMKIDTCCVMSSVANVTPKISPRYLLRSPVSIRSAIQVMSSPPQGLPSNHPLPPPRATSRDQRPRSATTTKKPRCHLPEAPVACQGDPHRRARPRLLWEQTDQTHTRPALHQGRRGSV